MTHTRSALNYINKYNKDNYRQMPLSLHKEKDKHIIEFLETKPSRNGYIKALIVADMNRAEK